MELQERISLEENHAQIGRTVQVLVADSEGKKDAATRRLSGRAEDNRLVHFAVPEGAEEPRPGDVVTATVTSAAPFFIIADDTAQYAVRRTRSGDAWDRRQAESCGVPSPQSSAGGSVTVGLGMPVLRTVSA